MSKFYPNFLFSIVVTIVMNALDMVYHLATGWAVHLNYVAIKLSVIFLSVWMITQFIGIGKEEGVVASIFGPFMFYIYYVFAGATLNREIFRIDEQFWFFFLHAALMLIAYFAAWSFAKGKSHWARTTGFILAASFASIAFEALFLMIRMRIDGFDEETSARMMTLSLVAVPVIAYILGAMAGVLIDNFIKKNYLDRLVAGIIAFALIYLFSKDLTHAIFAFVFVNIAYYVIHSYKKGIISKAQ
ncbi:hypothetical protein J4234_05440 [Candidatus Woesearchaeota archaeon]|nr:hypothetical protein [Candidatus Woesearchaeota archaeon]